MNARRRQRSPRVRPGRFLETWLYQHAQAFVFSLGQFFKHPASNLLSAAVIGISLALPAAFYLVLDNAQRVLDNWEGAVRISLYLKQDVSGDQARRLAEQLRREDGVKDVRYISPDQALKEYKTASGFNQALDALKTNPLPAVLVVTPKLASLSSDRGEALLARLNHLSQVDSAQYDSRWIRRLLAIVRILQRGVIILACLLAIAVLLVVGNTIRLAINNRRIEIEINKLFGATNAFVQRPFLYSGLLHGMVGSLIAWILATGALLLLNSPIEHLATLYHSSFHLHGLGPRELLLLAGAGSGLGVAGSWLAVQRHIRHLDMG
ncbi:MAG: permease-like cell division protein FtsX [Gammaproteobacteria bacterium]|jgi:cell division transport system permease protein